MLAHSESKDIKKYYIDNRKQAGLKEHESSFGHSMKLELENKAIINLGSFIEEQVK